MKRFSFQRDQRLLSNDQFKAVLDCGRRFGDGLLTLYMAQNECGHARLGVSVGKSHGDAVARNRWKRLLREAFRQSQEQIPAGYDYVLLISSRRPKGKTHEQPTFEQVKASFLGLVKTEEPSKDMPDRPKRTDDG